MRRGRTKKVLDLEKGERTNPIESGPLWLEICESILLGDEGLMR